MTERNSDAVTREARTLAIGPSHVAWDGQALTIDIDEVTAPLPSRIRGRVRVHPSAICARSFALDDDARHVWRPIAPRARVEVELSKPGLSWRGDGYFDANAGIEPLEDGFAAWDWSRAHLSRDTAVLYDGIRRDGSEFALALRIDRDGVAREVDSPPRATLPSTAWRVARATRRDAGAAAHVRRTFEDSPFYARSALTTHLYGEAVEAIHESLSLDRFRSPIVRAMLPFRMPRRF
jgi:carotenoid 1,2-hydratase